MMIPLAILLAFVGLVAFYWALRSGQFDDVETPAQRMAARYDELGLLLSDEHDAERIMDDVRSFMSRPAAQ